MKTYTLTGEELNQLIGQAFIAGWHAQEVRMIQLLGGKFTHHGPGPYAKQIGKTQRELLAQFEDKAAE